MLMRLSNSTRAVAIAATLLTCSVAQAQFGLPNIFQPRTRPQQQPQRQQPQQPQQQRKVAEVGKSGTQWDDGLKRHAVIVGISSYAASDLSPLAGIENDARQISETLISGGFPEENVKLLVTGSDDIRLQPTRANINREIDTVIRNAGEDAVVMIMLIGHGLSVGKKGYFCPADAQSGARFSESAAEQSLIPVQSVVERMRGPRIKQKLLIVDACRNAADDDVRGIETVDTSKHDVWLINSCGQGQFANVGDPDNTGNQHALYSYFFCEGLKGKADSYGDKLGTVSIREAHKWAKRRLDRALANDDREQTPLVVNGGGSVPLVRVSRVLPAQNRVTGDADLERALSASHLAREADEIVSEAEGRFMNAVLQQIVKEDKVDPASFQDHHNLMCYVYGNYLTPALTLDEECSEAHLVRGYGFRATGDYASAFEEYESAGIDLEVYVSGRLGSKDDDLFTQDKNGNQMVNPDIPPERLRELISTVPLRSEPRSRAPQIGEVQASRNLIISDVEVVVDEDGQEEHWLEVKAIDDQPIARRGWIHESSVHWSREAGQLYVASSELNGNIPALLGAQQRASAVAVEVSRLSQAQRDLQTARQIVGIVGQFVAVPAEVDLGLSIAQMVVGIAEQGKIQEQNRAFYDYQLAAQNAPRIMAERIRLLRANELEPIQGRPVQVSDSPWSLARSAPKREE